MKTIVVIVVSLAPIRSKRQKHITRKKQRNKK
jgi:hypothetical protein